MPTPESLNLEGLDLSPEALEALFRIDCDAWREELAGLRGLYEKIGDRLPEELWQQYRALEERLESG